MSVEVTELLVIIFGDVICIFWYFMKGNNIPCF